MATQIFDRLLRRISVRVRIIGGFMLIMLIAGSISPIILSNLNSLVTRLEKFTNVDAKIERLLLLTSRQLATSQLDLNRYIEDTVPSPYEALDDVNQAIQGLNEAQAIAPDPEQVKTIALIIQSLKDYQGQIADLQKTRAAGNNAEATRLEAKSQKLGNDIGIRLELMVNSNVKLVDATNAAVLNDARQSISIGFVVIAIGLILAITLSILISASVTRPLAELRAGTEAFQKGDTVSVLNVAGSDEFTVLARIFNNLTKQIQESISGLEKRVADRTKALATSAEVSRRLSTIFDQKQLVIEVVEQVKTAFNYYHAHIYLYDEAGEELLMAGGTGEAGKTLLARGHKIPKGKGLVGRAAETNVAVLVSDTSKDRDWLPNPLLLETKSEAAVPISIGDRVLGVLDVQQNVTDGLQQEDVDALQSIANQVAIALQNIQSTEIVAKRATELQKVATISTAAATITDVQKMLESVVHLTQRGFGLYHAHVFVYHEDTTTLKIAACGWKEGDEHEGAHGTAEIPLEQEKSLVARAARTRQAVIVNDVHNEPGWLPNPMLPDTASELAVPLIVGDQLLGVLDVQSEHLNVFTEEDASIQTTLASQVATAMQNARSFSQSQDQAKRETAVNLITQKIQNATTMESALQVAVRELGRALEARTSVRLKPVSDQEVHNDLVEEGAS
jgi:GAF domain-containing protein/HAMP domain-containing protein